MIVDTKGWKYIESFQVENLDQRMEVWYREPSWHETLRCWFRRLPFRHFLFVRYPIGLLCNSCCRRHEAINSFRPHDIEAAEIMINHGRLL